MGEIKAGEPGRWSLADLAHAAAKPAVVDVGPVCFTSSMKVAACVRHAFVGFTALIAAACGTEGEGPPLSARQEPLSGPVSSLPYGSPHVRIDLPSTQCAGTVVGRNAVLTAGHCVCANSTTLSASAVKAILPFKPVGDVVDIRRFGTACEGNTVSDLQAALDFALLITASPFDLSDVSPARVYTNGDLPQKLASGELVDPARWYGIAGSGTLVRADLNRTKQPVFAGALVSVQMNPADPLQVLLQKGDSGGALTLIEASTGLPVVIGVNSSIQEPDGNVALLARTYDYAGAHPNGTKIREILPDADGDLVPDDIDNCLNVPNADQADPDKDGVGAACDACDGPDSDGDGLPDSCDPCPCSGGFEKNGDLDGDGVCDVCNPVSSITCSTYCAQNPVKDTCPGVQNAGQENCNAEAETGNDAAVLGDACDPVPCPGGSHRLGDPLSTEIVSSTHTKGGVIVTWLDTFAVDGLRLAPVGTHSVTGDGAGHPLEKPVVVPATDYRYCLSSAAISGVNCKDVAQIQDSVLGPTGTFRADEAENDTWHRVTLKPEKIKPGKKPGDPVFITGGPNASDQAFPYLSGSSYPRPWLWQDDFAYWAARWGDLVGLADGVPKLPGQGAGVVGSHGDTKVGLSDLSFGTGQHKKLNGVEVAENLANAVFANPGMVQQSKRWTTLDEPELLPGPWLQEDPLAALQPVAIAPGCPIDKSLLDFEAHQAQPLVGLAGGVPEHVGVLTPGRDVRLVGSVLGDRLRESLADSSLVFVNAAEASPFTGASARWPAALALSADGASLRETVTIRNGQVTGLRDRQVDVPRDELRAAAASAMTASRFVATYARSIGTTFVVRGANAGATLPAITWFSLEQATSGPLVTTYRPHEVLAATYSWRDRQVWILEETASGLGRLVRVDPASGAWTVVGAWPRAWVFDRHWLLLDGAGSVLLVATSSKLHKHAVISITPGDVPHVAGVLPHASGELVFRPGCDATGCWLPVRAKNKKGLPRLERIVTNEQLLPGGWAHLASCL